MRYSEGKAGKGAVSMRRSVTVLVLAATLLAGCATVRESRLNPFNWFGRSVPVEAAGDTNPLIPQRRAFARPEDVYRGVPIDQITELRVEPMPGGAIVTATGLAARQGPYEVRLVPLGDPDRADLRAYSFNVIYPAYRTAVGPARSREVTVATFLSDGELETVRMIRVQGARNARESRR